MDRYDFRREPVAFVMAWLIPVIILPWKSDRWQMLDNSQVHQMKLIAARKHSRATRVPQKELWSQIQQEFGL
jgi:hypothetical protein